MVQQEVERLRLANLREQFGNGVVALVRLADVFRLLVVLHRHAGVFHLDVFVADVDVLGNGDCTECEVGLDGLFGLTAQRFDETFGVLSGGLEPGLQFDSLALELLDGVLNPILQLSVDHRLRRVDLDEPGEGRRDLRTHLLADLVQRCLGETLAQALVPGLDRVELADVVADPVVGELREGEALDGCHRDGEVGCFVGALRYGTERERVAG